MYYTCYRLMVMKMFFYYFAIINLLSFLLYGFDKFRAIHHKYRISEMILLNMSVFGGVYGSIMGMYLFHHKTKKILFKLVNILFFIVYTIIVYYLIKKYGG